MSGAVFLSYASQDAAAALRICEALREAGVEVWFDQSELRGGDAWDQDIRKHIRECVLFVPVISAATQARREGYFRREWKLAVERTHDMADGTPFLLPVVIDGTPDREALVPDVFLRVQWTRLPGGGTPEAFVQRVRGLLGAGAAAGARESEMHPASFTAPGSAPVRAKHRRTMRWIAAVLAGSGACLGLLYVLHSGVRRPTEELPTAVATPSPVGGGTEAAGPTGPTAPRDPQLRRALQLINDVDGTAADANVAEELCRTVLGQHPMDPAATVALAQVESYILLRGFDREEPRFAEAKRDAERALVLAPDDPDALASMATYLYTRRVELPRAENLLRQAIALRPGDPYLYRTLNAVRSADPVVPEAEALAQEQKDAGRFPKDALTQYDLARHYRDAGRPEESEHYLDLAIKYGPISNAIIAKARLGLVLRGDIAGMKAVAGELPERYRSTDRVVFNQFIYACASRQYDIGIEALRSLPEPWLADFDYSGPRQLLEGELLLLKGKPDLARLSYEAALAELARHKAVVSFNFQSYWLEVWLLTRLGRLDEARARNAVIFAGYERPFRLYLGQNWWFNPIPSNLLLGEREKALSLMREAVRFQYGSTIIERALVIDPRMAPWTDDREIAAILSQGADGKETPAAAPSANLAATHAALPPAGSPRNWPIDPELKHAIQLLDGAEAVTEDFLLAEEIAKRAVDRDPANPEAATVMARVQNDFLMRGFDRSDTRAALGKRAAVRALQLAPDEPQALLAMADFLLFRGSDLPRAERLLRRALELDPGEPRYGWTLAEAIGEQHPGEGIKAAEETVARFPGDALSHYDLSRLYRLAGRPADMERELDASLALGRIPNAIIWKARAMFALHGDLPGMKAWLDRMPDRVRSADRAVFSSFVYACMAGRPEIGLEALDGFPESWLADWEYSGPTALLRASLLAMQGKKELARVETRAGLAEVQRRKEANPADAGVRISEIWVLQGLGRLDEARELNRVGLEAMERPYRINSFTSWWFQPIPRSLLIGDRGTALLLMREAVGEPGGRETIRLWVRLDPRMAPWRGDKEIMSLLGDPGPRK